jgi:hypothetical protein
MPKIGSQTIENTLKHNSLPCPVLRFHYLSGAFARTLRHGLSSAQAGPEWKQNAQFQLDVVRERAGALRWRRILSFCGFKIPRLEIITGMRELIGLMLASIFENYSYFTPNVESMTADKCRDVLLHPKTFETLRDWFDLELKAFTGIDVFRAPFPFGLGHATYQNRFAKVLVYRFESIDKLPVLISDFLNCMIPELVSSNVGDYKLYADQYRSVKDQLKLPTDFVTDLYETRMMRHFYSDSERARFQARWSQH